MRMRTRNVLGCIVFPLLTLCTASAADVQKDNMTNIEFGSNLSEHANDGLCSDPRFEISSEHQDGSSEMAEETPSHDMFADARDCYLAFQKKTIKLRDMIGGIEFQVSADENRDSVCDDPGFVSLVKVNFVEELSAPRADKNEYDCWIAVLSGKLGIYNQRHKIAFGDDSSLWSNDDECDDPRFRGEGVAEKLSNRDLGRDATDCLKAMNDDIIEPRRADRPVLDENGNNIFFGDNSGKWPFDFECDDVRFMKSGSVNIKSGSVMGSSTSRESIEADAADCYDAYVAGNIVLTRIPESPPNDIDFGDDTSEYAYDGECDDPRFENNSNESTMAEFLTNEDIKKDATDCYRAYVAGNIILTRFPESPPDDIDFGDDTSEYAYDGECDDPRFENNSNESTMAEFPANEDIKKDATDCYRAYRDEKILLK